MTRSTCTIIDLMSMFYFYYLVLHNQHLLSQAIIQLNSEEKNSSNIQAIISAAQAIQRSCQYKCLAPFPFIHCSFFIAIPSLIIVTFCLAKLARFLMARILLLPHQNFRTGHASTNLKRKLSIL